MLLLNLSAPKSYNFVASPGLIVGPLLRLPQNAKRQANLGLADLDTRQHHSIRTLSAEEMQQQKTPPPTCKKQLPFNWQVQICRLGVSFGLIFTYAAHARRILSRAKAGQAASARPRQPGWHITTWDWRLTFQELHTSPYSHASFVTAWLQRAQDYMENRFGR